ncbi:hypothetical protein Tco_0688176, partial [Tanacetum coccineum]
MGSNEETNAAGTDTRPPMLVESDYDSWKIRIHRYIRGKPNGKLIWKSIQNGPTPHPMITDPPPTDSTIVPAPRKKLDSEFSEEENKLEMADTQAEIILSQGLPRHIFNNLNQTSTAKEIWDNVEMLMQGSGRTIQQRKEDLFDEYERFRAIGNESIHDYFVRFHKLVNDMKITQLNIPTHQMNTKFVNNLPAYWGKYVTNVKQNMDISTTPYVQIYTHLKAYEPHAKKTLKKQEQSTSIVDPLAYVAHTTTAPVLPSPSTSSPQPTAYSGLPPTQGLIATVHDGHIVTEPVQRKAPEEKDMLLGSVKNPRERWTLSTSKIKRTDGSLKRKRCVRAEAEAFLADTWMKHNIAVAFMANLSSTSATTNPVNEVHSNDNQIFDNVDYQLSQEMHQEIIFRLVDGSEIDDKYDSVSSVSFLTPKPQYVPTEVSADTSDKRHPKTCQGILGTRNQGLSGGDGGGKVIWPMRASQPVLYDADTLLHPNHHPVSIWDSEEVLVHQVVSMKKMNEKPGHVRPANGFYDKLNALMFIPQKDLSGDQAYWLSANEIASQASKSATLLTLLFVKTTPSHLRKQLQGKDDTIRNLDAQISIMKVLNVGSTEGSCEQQALETNRIQLKDAITSFRIQNDGFKAENVNLKRHYEELSKSNAYSRSTFTTKINALTAENAILKTELSGKKSSGSTASEKPKVLASGMYTKSSKYISPPK